MNAKQLLLTITMALVGMTSAWGATDVVSLSALSGKGLTDGDYSSKTGMQFSSSAVYAAYNMYYEAGSLFALGTSGSFVTTTSAGTVSSVSVVWLNSSLNVSGGKNATVSVYASHNKFSGSETKSTLASKSDYIGDIEYNTTTTLAIPNDEDGKPYEFVAITGCANEANLTQISIVWAEATKYAITIQDDIEGGTVTVDKETAAADELVKITFKPSRRHSLISYSFDDIVFDMSCRALVTAPESYEVYFPMPARPVTIDATFEIVNLYEAVLSIDKTIKTVQSGKELELSFTYTIDSGTDPTPEYNGTITVTSANSSRVYADDPVKVSEGNYTFKVHGLETGNSRVVVTAPKAGRISADATDNVTITVEQRPVALVSTISGAETSYYAMVNNSITDGVVAAQELIKVGDDYYSSPAGASIANLTWNATTLNKAASQFTYQNSANRYLTASDFDLSLETSSFTWINRGGFRYDNTGKNFLVYGQGFDGFTMDGSNAGGVKEVDVEHLRTAYRFSTSASVGANIVDARTLEDGKVGTICVPFDVPAGFISGAKFYTISGKTVSGGKLTGVMLDEATTLSAGRSYLFIASGEVLDLFYQAVTATNAIVDDSDGFVGSLPDDGKVYAVAGLDREDGYYGIKDNLLHYVASGSAYAKPYRALVYAKELKVVDPSAEASVPGRRYMRSTDNQEDVYTGVEELASATAIDWSKPVYNVMGIQVGRDAKGVLIQNGKKFFAQ